MSITHSKSAFRNFLSKEKESGPQPEVENPYPHLIDLLLQSIAQNAVEGETSDFDQYRANMTQLISRVNSETSAVDLQVIVHEASHATEGYNQRTSKVIRQQAYELQRMIAMLTKTVIAIGSEQKLSVAKLADIEKAIEVANQVEDIRALKVRLDECLLAVREESRRQKEGGPKTLQALEDLKPTQDGSAAIFLSETDPATELPNKREATKAIQAAVESPEGKFLLVAVVNRVQAVNARFGYAVGDQVLAAAAKHFKKNLASSATLFRWQGPTLIAVLDRGGRLDQVRAEVRRFADFKLENTVELGQRSVLIPVSASWCLLPVIPPQSTLMKQIDVFTAGQSSKDYV